jgi:catechol 2,3-dioxygenase-like lactoylglutathione lyase family enzyme
VSKVQIRGVDHLYLTVSEPERSLAFYDRLMGYLGLEKLERPMKVAIAAYESRAARFTLYLTPARRGRGPVDRYAPGLHHLSFEVGSRQEVDLVFRELLAMGAEILDAPADYPHYREQFYAVYFADPDGIKLEVAYRSWEDANKP